MKNGAKCPKCGGTHSIRISDNPYRYASGNNIYTTRATLLGKVPVIRYVCYDCGYVENWVAQPEARDQLRRTFGSRKIHKRRKSSIP